MGTIQDRNYKDLTEAERLRRTGKNTQNYTKKVLMTRITTVVCMLTHLEPDILECKVKWTLGGITMNKPSVGDGFPVELFQNLKDIL